MYVVLFNNKILRAVKKEWIQYPFLNTISKIFYSPHKDGEANFNLPTMQVFTTQRISCYMGLICKKYESEEEALNFIQMRYEVAESFYERDTSFLSTKNYCTPFIDDQNIPYVPSIVNEESKRNSHTHNIRKKDAYRAQHRTFQEKRHENVNTANITERVPTVGNIVVERNPRMEPPIECYDLGGELDCYDNDEFGSYIQNDESGKSKGCKCRKGRKCTKCVRLNHYRETKLVDFSDDNDMNTKRRDDVEKKSVKCTCFHKKKHHINQHLAKLGYEFPKEPCEKCLASKNESTSSSTSSASTRVTKNPKNFEREKLMANSNASESNSIDANADAADHDHQEAGNSREYGDVMGSCDNSSDLDNARPNKRVKLNNGSALNKIFHRGSDMASVSSTYSISSPNTVNNLSFTQQQSISNDTENSVSLHVQDKSANNSNKSSPSAHHDYTPFGEQNIPIVTPIMNEESTRKSHTYNNRKKNAKNVQHGKFQEKIRDSMQLTDKLSTIQLRNLKEIDNSKQADSMLAFCFVLYLINHF